MNTSISEVATDWDHNTGSHNAGSRNAGNYNTGNYNTGDCNTGYYNTGYRNTGDGNTGCRNTGNCNTGNCNATSRSTGVFCMERQTIPCFDVNTGLTWEEFMSKYSNQYQKLSNLIASDEAITDFGEFQSLPGFTPEKLALLHAKMIAGRNKKEN